VRAIAQEEMSKLKEKIDLNLLGELSRSATLPIGIWVEQKGRQLNHNRSHMSAEKEKAEVKVKDLFSRFNLVESGGYVRPRKSLSHDDFITLKNEFSELGYRY